MILLSTDYNWDKELQAYGTREVKTVPSLMLQKTSETHSAKIRVHQWQINIKISQFQDFFGGIKSMNRYVSSHGS